MSIQPRHVDVATWSQRSGEETNRTARAQLEGSWGGTMQRTQA